MGSSLLTSQNAGIFFHARGYQLSLAETQWNLKKTAFADKTDSIHLEVSEKNEAQIEISQLDAKTSLKNFSQKWNKDYYNFGFDILGKKELKIKHNAMLLVDLFHRKEKKNIRQVIISDAGANIEKKVFVLSCTYDAADSASVKNCNDLVMKFGWLKPHLAL